MRTSLSSGASVEFFTVVACPVFLCVSVQVVEQLTTAAVERMTGAMEGGERG